MIVCSLPDVAGDLADAAQLPAVLLLKAKTACTAGQQEEWLTSCALLLLLLLQTLHYAQSLVA